MSNWKQFLDVSDDDELNNNRRKPTKSEREAVIRKDIRRQNYREKQKVRSQNNDK